MAGNSTVLEDGSLLSRLDRRLLPLERFMALISGIAIFMLMVLAVASVGGRNLMNTPLPGYVDWIETAMPLIAFMGIAWVQREGGHIRMDMLVGRLRGRALWLFELISVVLILLLMIGLVWGSWAHFQRSFDINAPLWSRDSSIDIGIPIWPTKLLVPVAFSVLCARLLIQIAAYGRAFLLNSEHPPAVPLIQSVADQAAAEADLMQGQD